MSYDEIITQGHGADAGIFSLTVQQETNINVDDLLSKLTLSFVPLRL